MSSATASREDAGGEPPALGGMVRKDVSTTASRSPRLARIGTRGEGIKDASEGHRPPAAAGERFEPRTAQRGGRKSRRRHAAAPYPKLFPSSKSPISASSSAPMGGSGFSHGHQRSA